MNEPYTGITGWVLFMLGLVKFSMNQCKSDLNCILFIGIGIILMSISYFIGEKDE